MNQGGEPAHDDYGLPWVDVEIPDDASELDRDVQAYHRELRAMRRIARSNRWRAPLRKSGMMVPLIAGCLVLAMIGGMVLTMFSANPDLGGGTSTPPRHASSITPPSARPAGSAAVPAGSQSPSGAASASATASLLPVGKIAAGRSAISLRTLTTVAIAIIPAQCACASVIKRLLAKASSAGVKVYLVGLSGSKLRTLRRLAPPSTVRRAVLAIDADNALRSAYQPTSLKVLLVDSHRHVRPVTASQLDSALRSLG